MPLIKAIKADAQAWVQQYARGGSVRKQSARRFYIACDAVLGFMASNGCAPLAHTCHDSERVFLVGGYSLQAGVAAAPRSVPCVACTRAPLRPSPRRVPQAGPLPRKQDQDCACNH